MRSLSVLRFAIPFILLTPTLASVASRHYRRQNGPLDPSTIKDCTYYDTAVDSTYTCTYFENYWGLTHAQFVTYNPSVLQDCSGIKIGNSYCVEENHGLGPAQPSTTTTTTNSTTTAGPTGTPAPSPTQSGLASNCVNFYKVKPGDGCQAIVDSYGTFALSDFYTWNPAVKSDCTGLQANVYVCVGVPGTPTSRPTTPTPNGPSPVQSGIAANCQAYYKAVSGDTCQGIVNKYSNFTLADFYTWNPAVGSACSGLWVGEYYCIGVPGTPVPPTPTPTPTPSPTGPSPTQTGIVSNCQVYYQAVGGDTCEIITQRYGTFSLSDFYTWNPAVGSNCGGLWIGYYYCVGIPGTPTSPAATTTTSVISNAGPSPTEPGTISSCKTYYKVVSGDTCEAIEGRFGISAGDFGAWNPNVGTTCGGLWLDYYVCVRV